MPTGALIRDFVKEYRELRYTNSGSMALTEIEHNAYLNRLTIEIDHIDAPRYGNLKTLPMNTHYGYLTTFKGTSVIDCESVKFPRSRMIEIINQGIWNYHEMTEAVQISSGVSVAAATKSANSVVERIGENVGDVLCFIIGVGDALPGIPVPEFILNFLGCDEPGAESESITRKYRGFPISSPFPDIFKFKGDVPLSFRFRLESWYLVNPSVYIADNPTDTSDETEGEDEYPEPEQGDGDGDGDEFPTPSPVDPERDPRDFDEGNAPPPFEGGQCYTNYLVTVSYNDVFLGTPRSFSRTLTVPGPVSGIGPYSETDGELSIKANNQSFKTGLTSLPSPCSLYPENYSGCVAKIESIVRADGLPDDCGNPVPGSVGEIN